MIISIFLALTLSAAAGTPAVPPAKPAAPVEKKVSFKTPDGWTITGLYRAPRKGGVVLILAHGVGSAKGEWAGFTSQLAAKGVGTLAIDLRGHADSKKGPKGTRDYSDFDTTGEWPKAEADLEAAADWLKARGVKEEHIALGGASIGANLASVAAAKRPKTPFLLLMSAGVEYRGVQLTKPMTKTLAVASAQDLGAFQTLKPLSSVSGVEILQAADGHGVQMFVDPVTFGKILDWTVAAADAADPKPAP